MAKQFRTIPDYVEFGKQVNEYLDWCKVRQSPVTIKEKYYHYARLYQETRIKRLEDLTNEVVETWLALMAKGNKKTGKKAGPVTLNRAMTDIKSLVNWHREMGNTQIPIKLMLLERIKVHEPEQVFYSKKEIRKVIKHTKDPKARLMIRIGFDTGIRASELARLRLEHIQGQKLTFVAKGGKVRRTYISFTTAILLKRYIKKNGIEDFLWAGRHEGHIAYNTMLRLMRKPFKEAGLNDFHPHALRHSFVADLEQRGASNDEIQVMVGHSNPKTTLIYRHRIRKDIYLRKLHRKFHKWVL